MEKAQRTLLIESKKHVSFQSLGGANAALEVTRTTFYIAAREYPSTNLPFAVQTKLNLRPELLFVFCPF